MFKDETVIKSAGYLKQFALLTTILSLSGCGLSPKKVDPTEQYNAVNANLEEAQKIQASLPTKLTLSEAIARALKYNLDDRLHKYKIALTSGQANLAKWQLAPNPEIFFDEAYRSNEYIPLDQNKVPSDSTFTPQNIETSKYNITWNILDFGLSYIRAKQKYDEIHIAQEQERKIVQQLVSQVMISYWQAYQTQELEPQLIALRKEVELAIWRSKKIKAAQATDDIMQLEYEQLLIRNLRRTTKLYLQIVKGKEELASLISAPPNSHFTLAPPPANFTKLQKLDLSMPQLGTIALVYRPELRELTYRKRIAQAGVSEAVLGVLPSVNLLGGREQTSNTYVLNQQWYNVNASLTWSLIKLLSLSSSLKSADAQINIEKMTQAALSLAVIMQVNLAYNEYQLLQVDYKDSLAEVATEDEIYDKTKILLKAYRSNEQALVRRKLNYFSALLDEDVSLSALYTALGKLKMAVGMNYLPGITSEEVNKAPLSSLTELVRQELAVTLDKSFSQQVHATYNQLMHEVTQFQATEKHPEKAGAMTSPKME